MCIKTRRTFASWSETMKAAPSTPLRSASSTICSPPRCIIRRCCAISTMPTMPRDILTGLGIDLKSEDPKLKPELQSQLVREGAFEFNPARHDYGDKTFLGHVIKGRGLAEADKAIDILGHHP